MRGAASVVTLFAVAALLVGAALLLRRPTSPGAPASHHIPLPTPTSTPSPPPPLAWQKEPLPAGVLLSVGAAPGAASGNSGSASATTPNAAFAIAPSNGNIAYICDTPATGAPQLWRTLDAGQAWAPLPGLPNVGYVTCGLLIDQNDPLTVLASFATTPNLNSIEVTSGYATTYALFDGAAQWQPLDGGPVAFDSMSQFASWHGTYYATISVATPTSLQSTLSVSTDHMQTWQAIDRQIVVGDQMAPSGETGEVGFWVNSTTGALLAQTYNEARPGELWASADHGATWNAVVLPPSPVSEAGETNNSVTGASVFVQQPTTGQAFQLCAWYTEKLYAGVDPFYCSRDGGRTWAKRGAPDGGGVYVYGLMANGMLLERDGASFYLLPANDPNAHTGLAIGSLPLSVATVYYANTFGATPTGMTLWQFDGEQSVFVAQYTLPAY